MSRSVLFALGLLGVCVCNEFAFPPYCAKVGPSLVPLRSIPELSSVSSKAQLNLLQVFTIVRHGARTPAGKYDCWPGYKPQWNCRIEQVVTQHLATDSLVDAAKDTDLEGGSWRSLFTKEQPPPSSDSFDFRKIYDADPAANVLGGTCMKGQLLAEGYQQHELIGYQMAEAYQNGKLGLPPLIDHDLASEQIYFRSSDLQRTVASGSILLSSFFRTADVSYSQIPVHTIDEEQDWIFPNMHICPALANIRERIFASTAYQETRARHAELEEHLRVAIKRDNVADIWPGEIFDCLITTVCSEQLDLLPPGLRPSVTFLPRDHPGSEEPAPSLLNQTFEAVNDFANFEYTWRHSMFSKTAMARLMVDFKSELFRAVVADLSRRHSAEATAEILADIVSAPALNEFYTLVTQSRRTISAGPKNAFDAKRFVLFAAHDTTIMPFLAAFEGQVFDGKWPAYASQLTFELYHSPANSEYSFRTIYNGKVITHAIPGCQQSSENVYGNDLCSIATLFENTAWATPSSARRMCQVDGEIVFTRSRYTNMLDEYLGRRYIFSVIAAVTLLVSCSAILARSGLRFGRQDTGES